MAELKMSMGVERVGYFLKDFCREQRGAGKQSTWGRSPPLESEREFNCSGSEASPCGGSPPHQSLFYTPVGCPWGPQLAGWRLRDEHLTGHHRAEQLCCSPFPCAWGLAGNGPAEAR